MMYLFVYYGNGQQLSDEQRTQNRQAWQTWDAELGEVYGIRTAMGGKVVTPDTVEDYTGNLKGASIIEAGSLEEAVEKAKKSPSVQFGGRVEVFAEFER